MKKFIYTALLSTALIQIPPAEASWRSFTHGVSHAFHKATHGIEHTTQQVTQGITKTVQKTVEKVSQTAKKAVEGIKDAAWKTGDGFKKAGYVTGDAFKTAGYATGKALTSKEFVEGLKVAAFVGDKALTTLVPEVAAAMQIPAVKQMHDQLMQKMLAPPQPQRQPAPAGEPAPPADPNAPAPEVLAKIKEPVTGILTATLCESRYKKYILEDMEKISGDDLKNVKNATISLAAGRFDEDAMVALFQSAADGSLTDLLVLAMLFNGAKPDAPAAIRKISSACPA